jgi:hypothetical protein
MATGGVMTLQAPESLDSELRDHWQTYRIFARSVVLVAALALFVLAALAYFFM